MLCLVGCGAAEGPGRPGLPVEITIDEQDWAALRTARTVKRFENEQHFFSIRFGDGRALAAGYTIRGETSLKRAFQSKRPERLNYSVELPQAVPFGRGVRLERLYLMNMIFDPDYFEMRLCYDLLAELGLFPAHNQLVKVGVNGEPVGLYLLVERPKDALLRIAPELVSIHRRSYDEKGIRGLYEPVFRRWPGAGGNLIQRLEDAVASLRGEALETELDQILDLDGYLRWLAFNSLVRNADSYDEVFLYQVRSRDHPEGRLRLMAWDYDDVMRPRPAHPRLALDDPLLFAAEATLDRRIRSEPGLYARYREVLRELLTARLTPERLRAALERTRLEVEGADLGLAPDEREAFLERRRASMAEFERELLARRSELLARVGEPVDDGKGGRARTRRAGRESQRAPDVLWRDARLDADAVVSSGVRFEVTAPASTESGRPLPIVVRAIGRGGRVDRSISGWLGLEVEGPGRLAGDELLLRRGVGSITTTVEADGAIELGVASLGSDRPLGPRRLEIAAPPPRVLSGSLTGDDLRWREGETVFLDGDASVEAGLTLVIERGATVRFGPRVNLRVGGDFESRGEPERPIVVQPATAGDPWGGIVHQGEAVYRWTFLTGGGGDPEGRYGHSRSQAMIFGRSGSRIDLEHAFLIDAPGKGIGGTGTEMVVRDCLVSRTDMGGELLGSRILVERAWFLDFPDLGAPFRDDDNDALYLRGDLSRDDGGAARPSEIVDSVFIGGIDDGVDHFGATVEIRRSWIQGFSHEGVAASVSGSVLIEDTVVTGCEQGIEAGVGSPAVSARHVLLFDNDVGARYGDAYGARSAGTLQLSDSVLVDNRTQALRNWLHGTGGPSPRGIGLERSLTDGGSWDRGDGNVVGRALLGDDLLLAPGSPGRGIAREGADPGLRTPRPAGPPG